MGDRKHSMSFGALRGQGHWEDDCEQISWDDRHACWLSDLGRMIWLMPRSRIKPAYDKNDPKDVSWRQSLKGGYQATSIVICRNGIVIGGGIHTANGSKGFVRVLSLDKGATVAEQLFDAPLACNGLAVASGRIYASIENGSVVCMGK